MTTPALPLPPHPDHFRESDDLSHGGRRIPTTRPRGNARSGRPRGALRAR